MGIVKTNEVGPNNGVDLNLISGPGGNVYVNGKIITGSGSVIIGPQGVTGATGVPGETGATGATGSKGDKGDTGFPGLDGAVAPAGLTWRGSWSGTQSYATSSVVGYASASWWSKVYIAGIVGPITPNSAPNIDTTRWALLATQGPVGPQGIKGATGPQGPTGIGSQGQRGIPGPTGSPGPGIASQVTYAPLGVSITGSNVQLALSQLEVLVDQLDTQDTYIPSGLTLTSDTVKGAILQLDSLVTDENVIMVKKGATGSGQFTTIKAAMDSISGPSESNRWTIAVGAGDFYEDTIVCKPWVNIVGHDRTTRVIAATSNQHIFEGADYASVISCLVTGAGSGYAAFHHSSPTGTPQSAFVIKDVIFGTNDSHVICYANTNQTTIQVIGGRYGDGFPFTNGFVAYNNNNSVAARILLLHCYSQGMLITGPTTFAKASGQNCEIVMNSVQANANTLVTGTTFLQIEKGAKCRLNAVNMSYWDNGIYNKYYNLVGELPSKLIGVAISCQNTNNQIVLEHPTTSGSLSGSFDTDTITTKSPNCSIVVQDTASGDFTISGGLNIRYSPTVITDVSTLISQSSTMGVISGGQLLITSGLTLSIAEGYGYYHNNILNGPGILNKLTWGNQSIAIPASSTLYVYFNNDGDLVYNPTIPITSENILLGRVRTNGSGFEFIEKTPLNAEHWSNRATKLFRKGIGPVYSNGSILSVTQSFKLNVSPGTFYYGANEFNPSGGTGITFSSYRPNGSGGWIISTTNSVDSNYYAGTNSLISLSASYYTKHSIYLVGDNSEERYFMVYDTNQYSTQLAAQNASLPTPPNYFSDAVALIAGIIVQQGTASIVEIRDQRPVIGFRAPGINASADHSSLLNLNVDSHPQYLLTNGSRTLTGNLVMGSNSITGVNLINSVNITSHSSRHLPGGLDALPTGTPSTIGTFSQIGNQNAFARQDHIHAHGDQPGGSLHSVVTTTVSGFMSATDKVILDNITSSTQSLTNKGITGSTNYVDANGLKTTTNPVYIAGATAPNTNQVLMALSATQASWQTISTINVSTGTPSTIGITNQIGTSTNFAKQDHIHSHGDQLGGTLHSLVTITQSGFMSAPDKVILDNITTSSQTLTNKGITGSTNYVDANGLKTTTNPVYIAGATAPSINQVLMAISATQATWQTPMNVTSTQSGYMSAVDKVILDNITSSTQSLTNKGITGSTNYVDANGLKTTTNPVYIVSAAPSIGQVLISTSATQATWQTIPTGTPSTIGTVSQIGTSTNFAKQDHIHSHGDQLGGTLHATASTTTAGFMSATDKVILDNITSSTQSLTNKTIIGNTNYVDANGLKTTTNPVYIVAIAPSVNQVLTAVSATAATWQTPQSASSQKTPVDPATTSSTVGVMMGLSASITPVLTGKIMIIISGDMDNDSGDDGAQVQMRTGTGTPPINGASATASTSGTAQGGLVKMGVATSGAGANSVTRVPFSLNAIQSGLTLNTAVWIDVSLAAIGGGNARVRDISISVVEL